MAITIERQPEQLQPSMTDGLFYTLSSTKTGQFKYRYIFEVYVNNTKVFTGKSTPNPEGLGVIDITDIIRTYANSSVQTTDGVTNEYIHETDKFSLFQDNEVIDYYVVFGEEYATSTTSPVVQYNGLTDTQGSPILQSSLRKAFNGTYPTNIYGNRQDFVNTPYILNTTPVQYQQGLFLTNSPRIVDVSMNDRHTLSFFNYELGGDLISYGYEVDYSFYDSSGNYISGTTLENTTANGGGPLTGITGLAYDDVGIVPSAWTYNVVNVATGPYNLNQSVGIPANTKYYQVQLKGKNQSSSVGCPTGYIAAYVESCGFGYQIPVCVLSSETTSRYYWPPSGATSQWNSDCFYYSQAGGPGGEIFTGGTNYGTDCSACYDDSMGGRPESPPNIISSTGSTLTGLTGVSETFQFNIEDDCDYWNNKQLLWKNRYGAFDYYKFNKRKSEGLNIDRQTYKQIPVSWGSSDPQKSRISRGLTDFNVTMNESHVINTGFVNQATMVWLEECYTSPEVYLIETDGTLFPINITSTEYIRKNRGNKELINLELTYTYSNNITLI